MLLPVFKKMGKNVSNCPKRVLTFKVYYFKLRIYVLQYYIFIVLKKMRYIVLALEGSDINVQLLFLNDFVSVIFTN